MMFSMLDNCLFACFVHEAKRQMKNMIVSFFILLDFLKFLQRYIFFLEKKIFLIAYFL